MSRAPLLCLALLTACPGGADDTSTSTSTSNTTTTSATGTGTTVMPTTGELAELQRCTPHCGVDADCQVDGQDIGFVCREGVCDTPVCSDDATCRARLSGWTIACADADACSPLTACIVVGADAGACAYVPGPDLACADLGLDELTATAIAGGDVLVCGDADATCVDARCVSPCTSDSDCSVQQGTPHCDIGTGACQCTGDLDCQQTGAPGLVACLGGRCGCEVDADCAGGDNVDVCRAGACGCSGPEACSAPVFDRATLVCEPA